MCGVVSYFGSDPDVISRIITGMSAIIYRAPDSTGIGTFGNLSEPIVMKKCLGSVSNLIPVLLEHPCYGHTAPLIKTLWKDFGEMTSGEMQKRLITFEHLSTASYDAVSNEELCYLTHFDLMTRDYEGNANQNFSSLLPLIPGTPGRPTPLVPFQIRSRNDFRKMIATLTTTYNCSAVAIKSLLREELNKRYRIRLSDPDQQSTQQNDFNGVTQADIFNAFDYLFLKTVEELRPVVNKERDNFKRFYINPHAKKALWKLISSMRIQVPNDFDTDGIRYVFRVIDAALLTGISFQPGLLENIQWAFEKSIRHHYDHGHVNAHGSGNVPSASNSKTSGQNNSDDQSGVKVDWLTLYAVERALNVFGVAAACALDWCITHRLFSESVNSKKEIVNHPDLPHALTDPIRLESIESESITAHADRMNTRKGISNNAHSIASTSLPLSTVLSYLNPPMIAHGRWALQSSVTVDNAHPFVDQAGQRSIALNGQFSLDVEEEMKTFLVNVANIPLKTDNSGEYMALFWGYYYETMIREKQQYQEIRSQVDLDLDSYGIGSNTVNFQILNLLKDKSAADIDALAFIRAAELFTRKGGQIAVVGISMISPGTIFAAASNRPLFIVKRADKDSFMVVSDINAALGLFSQEEILQITQEYDALVTERDKQLQESDPTKNWEAEWEVLNAKFNEDADKILSQFKVLMYTLEGKDLFAKIDTRLEKGREEVTGNVERRVTITDFEGNEVHDIIPEYLNLTPPHVHKDLELSFFESHMQQIPELLETMCDTVLDTENAIQPIQVNKKILLRRFGSQMSGLKRIFLIGMGSSHHTAINAAPLIRSLMPGIQIICTRPVDLPYIARRISSDQDLVLMLSWSATTADMVDCAKKLRQMGTITIGITEKTVGDLALITRKSGGTVQAMSGEEVTVPAVKSPFCMMMATQLFALWFKQHLLLEEPDQTIYAQMRQIPIEIDSLMSNRTFMNDIHSLAFDIAAKESVLIVDNLNESAVARDAALKIEEMSWTFKGRCVDYSELPLALIRGNREKMFIIVNATSEERRFDAIGAMMHLHREGADFITLTWEMRESDQIEKMSRQVIRIPRLPDHMQPYADLIFYYQFAFYSGRARGRIDDDYPRNRAKSVTTSRSAPVFEFAPQTELFNIRHREALFDETRFRHGRSSESENFDTSEIDENNKISQSALHFGTRFAWERHTHLFHHQTLSTFDHFKRIGQAILSENPLDALMGHFPSSQMDELAAHLFDGDGDGEICFYPLDSISKGAVEQTIMASARYFPIMMRCAHPGESSDGLPAETVIVFVSATEYNNPPDSWCHADVTQKIWLTPNAADRNRNSVPFSIVMVHFAESFEKVDHCLIYTALMQLLLTVWSQSNREDGSLLLNHFKHGADVISTILNNESLFDEIKEVARRNQTYHSLLYLSPPDGSGYGFTSHFDESGSCFAQWESFGSSAHGALVTVDSDVATKYTLLESKGKMIEKYGKEQIQIWEKKYLQGKDVDTFLDTVPTTSGHLVNSPFFSEGAWYLPLLRPEYDVSQDNLIILNASNEFFFNHAIDDLTVFGCRHARMVVISQEYFINKPEKKALELFPFSGMLFIPSLKGDDRPVPLSDCHLPFAEGLIAAALSDLLSDRHNT